MESLPFDLESYAHIGSNSRRSAEVVVPLVIDLLTPKSVVDFGCGTGAWLSVWQEHGAEVLGLEAGAVDATVAAIPTDLIRATNLENPVELGRQYDLAMSIEVAEHLPHSLAPTLVASMARHSDAVLFSAAIPGQGGTAHINEQWPTYWAELFAAHDFACFDPFRQRLWGEDDRVEWWYQQNLLLFARLAPRQWLEARGLVPSPPTLLVHPELFTRTVHRADRARGIREHTVGLGQALQRRFRP